MKFNNFWARYNNRVWLPAIVYIFGYFSYDWLTNASHTISQRQTAIQADSPSRWCCWCERSQSCSTFRRSVRSRSKRCSDGWWRRPGHHRISCDSLMIKKCSIESWCSGYGRRLMFQRLWVRNPEPYTGWTFFIFICCKNCNVCLKRRK